MYGGPVYPGTLTYRGTVPNIELIKPASALRSVKGRGEISGYPIAVTRICFGRSCFTERGAAGRANAYENPENKRGASQAWGERLQLNRTDFGGGNFHHPVGGFGLYPDAADEAAA